MFLDFKKTIILVFSSLLVYYALISPKILPRVTICPIDAFCVTVFEIATILLIRYLSMLEVRELENEIRVQHSLMKEIINNTSLVMYIKRTDGSILLSNNKFAELLGLKPEQIVGLCATDFYEESDNGEEDKRIIETKQSIIAERFIKLKNRDVGHWYKVIKAPVLNKHHEVISIVVVVENIDADKELEEKKRTFIATMTHDLKTPTLAQINALDLLLKDCFGEITKSQREILNQIKGSCKYMSNLIFAILDTYLYDNGSIKIKFDNFNIETLINETVEEISNLLRDKGQTVKIHSTLASNIITADKFQIKRVVLNLLSNANNHGYNDSEIEIYLRDTEDSFGIKFDVTNKSKYISDDVIEDIFAKYKKVKNAKFKKTSTGLGLYLSKQIIDAHNGEIHASSNRDTETSTFGFSIPKEPAEDLLVVDNK